jgi:hypothetical protein
MTMPQFTAEASLSRDRYPSIHREVLRDFDNRSRIVPARSWIGDVICEGALRDCFDDVPGACGLYGSWCTLGGLFE